MFVSLQNDHLSTFDNREAAKVPSSTETRESVLNELNMLARRIKEGRTTDDLRRLLNLMNDLSRRLPDDAPITAKYNFLRGALYIKGAVVRGSWISSGGESLYYALDLLERSSDYAREALSVNPTHVLQQFQQDCVFEAMVAVTTLRAWGRNMPELLPDTGCLPIPVQRKIASHLTHGHPMRSRFA